MAVVTSPAPARTVVVREVGPRDGLQSLPDALPLDDRIELIERLLAAGVARVEVGAFVSPTAVPQMAGTDRVLAALAGHDEAELEVLVPNERGAQLALEAGARALTVVVAASPTFNHKNVGRTVDRSLLELEGIVALARQAGARCSVDVATSFGCAYEGRVSVAAVLDVVRRSVAAGAAEIVLADTTGMAAPNDVSRLYAESVAAAGPDIPVGLHFHNTRGLGLVNVMSGLSAGCELFDASIGGLGGCPFSPGATGNVTTEDLVHLLDRLEMASGIELNGLIDTARWFEQRSGVNLPGQVMRSGPSFPEAEVLAR